MRDTTNRAAILRRRMAFLGGALATIPACDKDPVPPASPDPTDVHVAPDGSTPQPVSSDEPPGPKPGPHPSTEIPATSCKEDREQLEGLKPRLDEIYAELDAIYAALPSCSIHDAACQPEQRTVASRFARVDEQIDGLSGLCGCPPPIVTEYLQKHTPEFSKLRDRIRDTIIANAKKDPVAGDVWDNLVQEEATPRPCLSCVYCEPKSGCD
jgi:hypothetical protein